MRARHVIDLALVFTANTVTITQYGFLLCFAVYQDGLMAHWNMTAAEARLVYTVTTLGANALCVLPGCIFDRYGSNVTLFCGGVCTCGGLLLTSLSPQLIYPGFFCFGLGTSTYNVAAVLTVLKVFPGKLAGAASAALLLFLALGLSLQAAVYSQIFESNFESYLVYMTLYSAAAALLPIASLSLSAASPSSAFSDDDVGMIQNFEGSRELQRSRSVSVENYARIMFSQSFFFLAAVFAHPVAFSFALLGNIGDVAISVGMTGEEVSSLVASLGIFSAVGRVVLGMPSDLAKTIRPWANRSFFFMISLLVYCCSLAFFVFATREYVRIAANLALLAYGGILGLVPGAIREEFGSEFVGFVYGILYTFVSVAVTVWSGLAPDRSPAGGEEFADSGGGYRLWFFTSLLLMLFCLLLSVREWRRSFHSSTADFLSWPSGYSCLRLSSVRKKCAG
eukprot:TRINITY_DN33109_c0_g1_i1.p1 TRINITY_DN33109_c0_g1~~TRINITY_DN33109_c0_g1_i1.p1  ORF type:complete len:451 (-),score=71.51 TRINITY_DN33109_c0_g1_i1:233-1585(-)